MSRSGYQTSSCLPAFLKQWTGLSRDSYSLIRCGMCPQTMKTPYLFSGSRPLSIIQQNTCLRLLRDPGGLFQKAFGTVENSASGVRGLPPSRAATMAPRPAFLATCERPAGCLLPHMSCGGDCSPRNSMSYIDSRTPFNLSVESA